MQQDPLTQQACELSEARHATVAMTPSVALGSNATVPLDITTSSSARTTCCKKLTSGSIWCIWQYTPILTQCTHLTAPATYQLLCHNALKDSDVTYNNCTSACPTQISANVREL